MKKILFLITFVSFLANAQMREKGNFEITPHLGFSDFYFSNESNESSGSLNSANYGILADYFFNNRWSIRSGLLYEPMGASDSSATFKLNYLNIPVNADWHFGSTRKWNLNFGLSPSFLMSAKLRGENIKENTNSFQLGLNLGIGYKLEVSEKFSVLFDYQLFSSFTDTFKNSDPVFSGITNVGSNFNIGGVFLIK